jgi:hypothetical protein
VNLVVLIRANPLQIRATALGGVPNLIGALTFPSPIGRTATLLQAANFHFQLCNVALLLPRFRQVSQSRRNGRIFLCQRAVPTYVDQLDPQGFP